MVSRIGVRASGPSTATGRDRGEKCNALDRSRLLGAVLLILAFVGAASPSPSAAGDSSEFSLDTSFTYQGRLQRQGAPAEGVFDLSFELYDAPEGGTSFGQINRFDVPIRRGAFAAELDFGHSVYSGTPAWLEVQVRPAGDQDRLVAVLGEAGPDGGADRPGAVDDVTHSCHSELGQSECEIAPLTQ